MRSGLDRQEQRDELAAMSTPKVTEIKPRPEPVAPDTFIDDLRSTRLARRSS